MALSLENIERHPHCVAILRERARQLLDMHAANPRISGVFATHQRWLLGHIVLLTQFETACTTGRSGTHASGVAAVAHEKGVASRNTTEAFLREMVAYGLVTSTADARDLRVHWLVVAPHALQAVATWVYGNLATLDAFDQGERARTFQAAPEALAIIQPICARRFLDWAQIRKPGPAFSLFDRVDEGGGVMDRLISTCRPDSDAQGRRLTEIASIADFGDHLRLSRSHLTRKLREAEAIGALGWTGPRGRSPLWISDVFVTEYITRIAAELAAVEEGYQAAFSATC